MRAKTSFHFVSGDGKLTRLEKNLYKASFALERMLNRFGRPPHVPVELYRPRLDRERFVAAFGEGALDFSATRIICLDFILEEAGHLFGPERAVLDIGCGSGRYAPFIRGAHGYRAYRGVDLKPDRSWDALVDAETTFGPAVLGEEPIDVSDVDTVFSQSVLEHVANDAAIFRLFSSRAPRTIRHLHFVPATASNEIYGYHGFRRYAPPTLGRLIEAGHLADARLHFFGNRFMRALHLDHYDHRNDPARSPRNRSGAFDPSRPMFDQLVERRERIVPQSPRDCDFFVLTGTQAVGPNRPGS